MIYWGINALNHGHSIAVFKDGELLSNHFGTDDELDSSTIYNSLHWGSPDRIYWYERPWIKKARQLRAGQWRRAFDLSVLPKQYLNRIRVHYPPVKYTPHHASHAAAGYYTSPFNHAAIVVLDAIGEFECATIWEAKHGEMKKVWSRSYPHSLGLFYSAFTDLLGLTPVKDEYILQQMSEKGDPRRYRWEISDYFNGMLNLTRNLHKGVLDWPHAIETDQDRYDIAAAVQDEFEYQVYQIMTEAKERTGADCLVYMGGCAMNSAANKKIVEPMWDYRWSLSNPGDPTSSIGAVLYHEKYRIKWEGPLAKHININV